MKSPNSFGSIRHGNCNLEWKSVGVGISYSLQNSRTWASVQEMVEINNSSIQNHDHPCGFHLEISNCYKLQRVIIISLWFGLSVFKKGNIQEA